MDRLKGKTILIGREVEQGCLAVAVLGCNKKATIGSVGSVPKSVSRCLPDKRTAHCKIDVDQSGTMTLTNLKPENFTYVGGLQIQSKKIDSTSVITLGKDRYPINLNLVLQTAIKIVGNSVIPPQPKTYSIKHLERVWDEYKEKCRVVKDTSRKIKLIRSLCGIFTSGALICVHFWGTIGFVLTGVGLIGNIYSFVGLKNNDTSEEIEKIDDWLDDNYICPNPDCHHSFGKTNKYKYLLQNGKCPYCRCNFTES